MLKTMKVTVLVVALNIVTLTLADGSTRSGWYLGTGVGIANSADVEQEGWNQDTFCYPDAACFDQNPIPSVSGYRWGYDISMDGGTGFELSLGRLIGQFRLELAASHQVNDTNQEFASIAYYDGSAVQLRMGDQVNSNSVGTLDQQRVLAVTLDAYYDFLDTWGAITPYIGVGIGQASVKMGEVRFTSNYQSESASPPNYDPPLSFYNSMQDENLSDTTLIWRLHAGAELSMNAETNLGLKLTWSSTEDIETKGAYEAHPMFTKDASFANTNVFSGGSHWRVMLTLRRGFGE